jgi:rubrerythrin
VVKPLRHQASNTDERHRDDVASRRRLITILQLAYSGERAAAYAYNGHWKAVADPEEKARIRQIEDEEWHHRRLVGEMLSALEAGPNPWREIRATVIGRALGFLCYVTPWFAPMYGAGRLESHNIGEYEDAARFARDSGLPELVDCLLTMAEVEWDHEAYFRSKVEGHPWAKIARIWPQPLPKATIRAATGSPLVGDGVASRPTDKGSPP